MVDALNAPHDPAFDAAWAKYGWARAHNAALEAELVRVLDNADPGRVIETAQTYDAARSWFSIQVTRMDWPAVRWGLMLGDVLAGYRAALDRAAWAIVERGETPPSSLTAAQRHGIAFPLPADDRALRDMIRHSIPGVSDSDLRLVRQALRPQRRPAFEVEADVVTFLSAHHDQDRHQFPDLHLRGAVDYRPQELIGRDCEPLGVQTTDRTPLRIGDTIARVHVHPTGPGPALDTAGLTVQAIPHLGTVALRPMVAHINEWIAQVLQSFSARPVDPGIDHSFDVR